MWAQPGLLGSASERGWGQVARVNSTTSLRLWPRGQPWSTWWNGWSGMQCWAEHLLRAGLCSSPDSYIKVITSSTSERDLTWKVDTCTCNSLRWGYTAVGWAPNPAWLVFFQKGEIWTQTCTLGKRHVKMKGEIGGCIYKLRNTKIASKPPEA